MSTTTARTTAFSPEENFVESAGAKNESRYVGGESPSVGRWPTFESHSGVYAQAARRAGRLNASSASDDELNALLAERQALLDKKFAGTITRPELNRLTYVGWSLDRIEDARSGGALDELENAVTRYERFAEELSTLQKQINQSKTRRQRK